MGSCVYLESFTLYGCHRITDISALARCSQLRTIELYDCPGIYDISFVSSCAMLESITLTHCYGITDLPTPTLALDGRVIKIIRL
jgi:hypothetical protein